MEAPDSLRLLNMVSAFIEIETLDASPGYAALQQKQITKSGLDNLELGTLLRMKKVFREYLDYRRKQESAKNGIRKR